MSAIVDAIVDAYSTFIAVVWTIASPMTVLILTQISDDFKDWYVESMAPVMKLFGIEEEDVVDTEVLDQRLMTDDQIDDLLTKVALDHQKTQRTIIDLLSVYSSKTRASVGKYYNYAKDTYAYGLPTANIRMSEVPLATESVIESEYGVDIVMIDSDVRVPTKEEHCYYTLNKLYGYLPYTNKLTYTGNEYVVKYMDYNLATDKYDITMFREATVQVNTITEVTVTITPYDATYDNKSTYTKVTEETIHSIEGTSYTVISEDTVDTLVAIGSESNSYISDTVYSTVTNIEYGTIVISINAFAPVLHLVVKWYDVTLDTSHYLYWTYELGSGNTLLDGSVRYLDNIEMMPIVELRNNKVNVNSDPTSELYKQTKEILDIIGMDVDAIVSAINESPSIADVEDAFVYFGLDVKDTSPTAAKMMYESVEIFYADKGLVGNDGSYSISVSEGKYNVAVLWKSQTRTAITGNIGVVNTYQMTTSGNSLVMRKQVDPETYVEYRLIDIATSTFIKRGAHVGVTTKTLQNDSIMFPISWYVMDMLSPLEQMEIFAKTLRLQTYAITITHLEWYQTEAFMALVEIVMYVVAVVLFILTLPAGGQGATAWLAFAGQVLLMYGASLALAKLLEGIDNPYLRMAITAIAMAAMAYGGASFNAGEMLSPDQLLTMVTEFSATDLLTGAIKVVQTGIEAMSEQYAEELADIMIASAALQTSYETRTKEMSDMQESMTTGITTDFVANLTAQTEVNSYIEGIDLMRWRAGPAQYEYGLIYNYDSIKDDWVSNQLKIGII